MSYTAWSVVFGEQPSASKWNILGTNDASFNDGTGIGDNAILARHLSSSIVGSDELVAGTPVQMVASSYSAVATGTATIPQDDTIPQITEGTEFMTRTITPKSATNILVIECVAFLSFTAANGAVTGAIFQDAVANGLAVSQTFVETSTGRVNLKVEHSMVAGTTSAITFRFRAGGEVAGTITFNGISGNRFYGATTKSLIKVTEYKA